ncbi:1-phosphofructokinase, partial [Streptomyces sp. SP17BM10]|nr:1-phosphofructokinase [Streptomyces sp. SP17BM10]
GTGAEAHAAAHAHRAPAVQQPGSVMPTPPDLDPAPVVVTADNPHQTPHPG